MSPIKEVLLIAWCVFMIFAGGVYTGYRIYEKLFFKETEKADQP